jgi:HAD superfamily hydrolase (TIGR01549 family)
LNTKLYKLLINKETIFWDFDGVIKESVKVKTNAFEELFSSFNRDIVKKICKHHEENTGMSRFEKIPVYLSWINKPVTVNNISLYCDEFSSIVSQRVIDSPWVPGVLEYLSNNGKKNIIVTATPYDEMIYILDSLNIACFFCNVYGAPTSKVDAISEFLKNSNANPSKSIMLGDSESDYQSAMVNNIQFALRRTSLNENLQNNYTCQMFDDFQDFSSDA